MNVTVLAVARNLTDLIVAVKW